MVRHLAYPYRAAAQMRTFYIPEMTLFELPEALRQRIYEVVLCEGKNTVPLLQTCRQILAEAQPLLLSAPVAFHSQYDLVEWIGTVGLTYAKGVRTLHLTLQDLEVLPASRDSGHLSWPSLSLLELYQSEAEKMLELLSKMPNITELSLLKPDTVRSYLYTDYYFAILRNATIDLPHIKAIKFHSDEHPLSFIKATPNLRKLSFTGYSQNSPMETSGILARLRHLEELEIILPNTPTVFGGLELEAALPKTQSLTREVLRELRGLKGFTLRESKDRYSPSPAFCTSTIIHALSSTHRAFLQKLKIELDFAPDVGCQRAIQSLCASSILKSIDVTWPGMCGYLLNSLPRTIVTLRTPTSFGRPPYWVMLVLHWKRSEIPNLKDLFLVGNARSSGLPTSATSTQAFRSAKATLVSLGIQTYIECLQPDLPVANRAAIRAASALA